MGLRLRVEHSSRGHNVKVEHTSSVRKQAMNGMSLMYDVPLHYEHVVVDGISVSHARQCSSGDEDRIVDSQDGSADDVLRDERVTVNGDAKLLQALFPTASPNVSLHYMPLDVF